jgi:signal transduction histidine kinase
MKFHDRIFAIFQRLHRAEDYPGTGVGLAIVRKAMERMGGRVWADSAPGRGATFTLELKEFA